MQTLVKFTSVQTSPHQASGHTRQPTSGASHAVSYFIGQGKGSLLRPSLTFSVSSTTVYT